jgi:hypothetical protein
MRKLYGTYVAVYRVREEATEIMRIYHAAQGRL